MKNKELICVKCKKNINFDNLIKEKKNIIRCQCWTLLKTNGLMIFDDEITEAKADDLFLILKKNITILPLLSIDKIELIINEKEKINKISFYKWFSILFKTLLFDLYKRIRLLLKRRTNIVARELYERTLIDYYKNLWDEYLFINKKFEFYYFRSIIFYNKISEEISNCLEDINYNLLVEWWAWDGKNLYLLNKKTNLKWKNILGFDYSLNRTWRWKEYLKNINNINFFLGNILNQPFKDKEVDIYLSVHCLEQLNNLAKPAIQEIKRVAKYAIIIEPVYKYQNIFWKIHNILAWYPKRLDKEILSVSEKVIHKKIIDIHFPLNKSVLYFVKLK